MNYQSTQIGFVVSGSAKSPAAPAPSFAPQSAYAAAPAPSVIKVLESELIAQAAYAAMLERELIARNAAAAGVPFYVQ